MWTIIKKGVDITPDRAYNIHVDFKRGINSVVECHLAKVKVASSNLVSRSTSKAVSNEAAFFAGQCFSPWWYMELCLKMLLADSDIRPFKKLMSKYPVIHFRHIKNKENYVSICITKIQT